MSDYWQFPQDSADDDASLTNAESADTDQSGPATSGAGPEDRYTDEALLASAGLDAPTPNDTRSDDVNASIGTDGPARSTKTAVPPPPTKGSPPPPPPWAQHSQFAPPSRLYRSRDHRLFGGVAGGIARHLGVDPLLIRFATVLVLMSGLGIFAYLAAWVLLPLEPSGAPTAPAQRRENTLGAAWARTRAQQTKSAVIILVIALALGAVFESFTFFALWLIGGGIWLLSQQPKPVLAHAQQAMSAAVADTPKTKVPLSEHDRQQWRRQYEWEAERYGWPTIGEAPAEVIVEAAPRQRQVITRLVLSLLLLLVALATAAAAGGWWDVQPTRMLGIALVTVGGGVVLGALFRNRARGLIPLGLLLAVAMIPTSIVTNGAGGIGAFDGGVGVQAFAPTTVAMLQPTYDHSFGELTIDFSQLDLAGQSRTVAVNVAAGEVQVLLPPDIGGSVSVEASVGEISVDLNGDHIGTRTLDGINIDTGPLPLTGSNGELFLKIKASVGEIGVRQVGS